MKGFFTEVEQTQREALFRCKWTLAGSQEKVNGEQLKGLQGAGEASCDGRTNRRIKGAHQLLLKATHCTLRGVGDIKSEHAYDQSFHSGSEGQTFRGLLVLGQPVAGVWRSLAQSEDNC